MRPLEHTHQKFIPYRLRPKTHKLVSRALEQKDRLFELIEKYGSPLNLIFPDIFKEKYRLFDELLSGEHLDYRLYFTCKPNRSNALLKAAAHLGSYVDVSSFGEFNAALNAGIEPKKISATGPKNRDYMNIVLEHRSLFVVDNFHEFDYLIQNGKEGQPYMLRLSMPSFSDIQSNDDTFGLSVRDIDEILRKIKENTSLEFHGFATHTTYSGYDEQAVYHHIEQAVEITLAAFEQGLTPSAINIGGGYPINYVESGKEWQSFLSAIKEGISGESAPATWDNAGMGFRLQNNAVIGAPSFVNHYHTVTGENHLEKILYHPLKCLDNASLLDFVRDSGLALYVEPGKSLMDQCGVTLATVNFTKYSSQGNVLVNLDMHHANLNTHSFKYMVEPIIIHKKDNLPPNHDAVFYYGSLCFASDLITFHKTYPDHLPESGDIAAFINTAAYRMDFAESEMLRHPNAKKICAIENGTSWDYVEDNQYKGLKNDC